MTYLYLLYHRTKLLDIRFKIGIGWHLYKRIEQIDKTTKGEQELVFAVILPFGAKRIEKLIHRLYKKYHAPFKSGSGRTEWFKLGFRVIEVVLIMMVVALVEWAVVAASFSGFLVVLLGWDRVVAAWELIIYALNNH